MNDLTVSFKHLNRESLLEDWHWLIGPSNRPTLLSSVGNAFVQNTEDGSVHLLRVGAAEIIPVANSYEEFEALLGNDDFVLNYFGVKIVVALQKAGIILQPGQIYSFKIPPLLGGEYALENVEATDISVHFSLLGQLAQQVMQLPPGTPIMGVTIS